MNIQLDRQVNQIFFERNNLEQIPLEQSKWVDKQIYSVMFMLINLFNV